MRHRLLFIISLAVLAVPFFLHESSSASASPVAEPQKATPESIAHAKKLYTYDCAVCHGAKGDGKGDMSGDFPGKIKDWTNPESLKGFTDEQLFTIIKDGKGDMPPEGKRAKSDDISGLVEYIRSFSKKE